MINSNIFTDNELENLGIIIRNEITNDGKLTKFGAFLVIYIGLALFISLPRMTLTRTLCKED